MMNSEFFDKLPLYIEDFSIFNPNIFWFLLDKGKRM